MGDRRVLYSLVSLTSYGLHSYSPHVHDLFAVSDKVFKLCIAESAQKEILDFNSQDILSFFSECFLYFSQQRKKFREVEPCLNGVITHCGDCEMVTVSVL